MVLELYANLPLVGLVPDEGVFQQLLRSGSLPMVLHQAALNKRLELFGPGGRRGSQVKAGARGVVTDVPLSPITTESPVSCDFWCKKTASKKASLGKIKHPHQSVMVGSY